MTMSREKIESIISHYSLQSDWWSGHVVDTLRHLLEERDRLAHEKVGLEAILVGAKAEHDRLLVEIEELQNGKINAG